MLHFDLLNILFFVLRNFFITPAIGNVSIRFLIEVKLIYQSHLNPTASITTKPMC